MIAQLNEIIFCDTAINEGRMAADILKLWMHSFSNEYMMRADPPSLQPPDKLKSTLPPLMSWIMLCCVNCQATSDKKLFG